MIEFKAGLKGIAAAGTGAFMVFGLLSAPAHAAPTAADKAADAAPAVTEAGEAADGEVGTLSHWPNPVNATNKKTVPGSSTTTSRGTMQLRRGVVDGQRMVWARAVNANSNLYIMLQFRRDDGSYGTSLPRRIGTRNYTNAAHATNTVARSFRACIIADPNDRRCNSNHAGPWVLRGDVWN
ncbi:hypothetical protein HNR23_001336 [Nocardiopsis mwathae]|uniref:Uncharacterized protein n=1 Tax=Nocardiopsis mwathae TaxID=1472723 RepID=A0A7X0D517_9ACTN|nr:hypothetical protein [Nocardiopsis mwathae]MBB6171276.1 hypothetical protein [Nocardiopsis mwathae]